MLRLVCFNVLKQNINIMEAVKVFLVQQTTKLYILKIILLFSSQFL